jgi:hypothetical protein
MIEVDKEQLGYEVYRENMASELGLVEIHAYHCSRCNYVWLPRDFDFNFNLRNNKTDGYWGHDLFFREPPKSCARCKSRSWRDIIPQRRLKKNHIFNDIGAEALEGLNNYLDYNRWITSRARYRALIKQKGDKLTNNDVFQF